MAGITEISDDESRKPSKQPSSNQPTLIQRIKTSSSDAKDQGLTISPEEQMRLFRETGNEHFAHFTRPFLTIKTGLLKPVHEQASEEIPQVPLTILFSTLLVVIYTILHAAVLLQFGRKISPFGEVDSDFLYILLQSVKVSPAVAFMVYMSIPHINKNWMQLLLAISACVCGWYNLRIMINHSSSYGELSKAPGLGVIWTYCLMQLNLKFASLSLLAVLCSYFVTLLMKNPITSMK